MLASYYKFAGVDGTVNVHHPLCDDPQFRASFDGAPIEWKLQTCDVLGCSRFDSIYCLKSWHPNASVDTYLSKTNCGNGTAARVVRGGNGSSTFLTCPHGGAALHVLETLSLGAAQLAARCEAAPQCVGFIASEHGGATLAPCEPQPWLPYHCGNASYFRVPAADAPPPPPFDGVLRDVGGGRLDAYLPPPFASSHASMIEQDASGRLHLAWFSGTGEGHSNVSIVYTQLSATDYTAGATWPAAAVVSRRPGYSNQNAVLYCNGSSLHLFHSQQPADKGEDNATVWHLVAPIDAATGATAAFSAPRELFSAPGSYDKNRVLERLDGSWLLPLYDSRVNSPFNAFLPRGADAGVPAQWELARYGGDCDLHLKQPTVVRIGHSPRLLAYFRDADSKHIWASTSDDDGASWSDCAPTPLPNNDAGIELWAMRSGALVLAFNPQTKGRDPLALAISDDGGATWAAQRTLEHEDGRQEFSYPTLREDVRRDGVIHVSYTWKRQTIKHSVVSEAWIRGTDTVRST